MKFQFGIYLSAFLLFGTVGGGRFKGTPATHRSCSEIKEIYPAALSGIYTISLSTGSLEVYCEMSINGGGYTFLSIEGVAKLSKEDLQHLFTDKSDVLLRISKPDGTQPYTVIKSMKNDGTLSVQLSQHANHNAPQNVNLGPYLYLGTLHKSDASQKTKQGFKSNGKEISFNNCDANPNSYFAFFPNPMEKAPSSYHMSNLVYERSGVAVNWRNSSKRPASTRRMPVDFFLFTEMHFGGCGCYTSSDRWLLSGTVNPALGTAIGLK